MPESPHEGPTTFTEAARLRLNAEWTAVNAATGDEPTAEEPAGDALAPEVAGAINRAVNSRTKTYRYVLPTQLLAKLVDPSVDAHCVQVSSGLSKAFDARSLCHEVVVDFDRANHNVLGGSSSPYISNPLRIPAVLARYRNQQKDKGAFDDLVRVLDEAQAFPDRVNALFRGVLLAIRLRLSAVTVVYPVPNRPSLKQTVSALNEFLAERSGGLRMQAVAVALFQTIGQRLGLFAHLRGADINAADASTGSAADLECVDGTGTVVLAVEVKDRPLALHDAQDKLPAVRERGIRELLFLVRGGVHGEDATAVAELIGRQFSTGQNIYVVEMGAFLESCLVIFAEVGRRDFLRRVGQELDERRADISHRRHWAALLNAI